MSLEIPELPESVAKEYEALKRLADGRICGVHRLLYHYTLHIDIDYCGYADRYCFPCKDSAMAAFTKYTGEEEPVGWHRHPPSGRRRNLATGEEWIAY